MDAEFRFYLFKSTNCNVAMVLLKKKKKKVLEITTV